jgi:hypothetical protein
MSFSGLYYDGQVIRQSDGPAIGPSVEMVQSGFIPSYKAVMDAGASCKTCDKPINLIVRVSVSLVYLFLFLSVWF